MYDSIDPFAIPFTAPLVAGYVDGPKSTWSPEGWDRFPNAIKIAICTYGPRNNGNCLDIENGDSTPQDAAPWANNRIENGIRWPILYCSLSDFPLVHHFTSHLSVQYWIAHYTQTPHIPLGADACQYADLPSVTGGNFDLSLCQPWFPRWLYQ